MNESIGLRAAADSTLRLVSVYMCAFVLFLTIPHVTAEVSIAERRSPDHRPRHNARSTRAPLLMARQSTLRTDATRSVSCHRRTSCLADTHLPSSQLVHVFSLLLLRASHRQFVVGGAEVRTLPDHARSDRLPIQPFSCTSILRTSRTEHAGRHKPSKPIMHERTRFACLIGLWSCRVCVRADSDLSADGSE
jgi:hypothetical protein